MILRIVARITLPERVLGSRLTSIAYLGAQLRLRPRARSAATFVIRSSRYQASREPLLCSESCTRSLPRLFVPPTLSLASLSPRWPCSDGTLSRPCSVYCSPILCATFVCRAELVLKCCDCAVGCSPAPMRAGRLFVAVSAPSASDEHGDSRPPHRRRRRRMRCQGR